MQIQNDVLLKNYTTTGIGGPAKFFVIVKTQDELVEAIKFAQEKNLEFLIIGGGSNLLVSDEGFPGLIIKNRIDGIRLQGQALEVQAGTLLGVLVDFTIQKGLSGLQKLASIPGTVGGAIYGNAGAFGQSAADCVEEVICFNGQKIVKFSKQECKFSYRDSIFKTNKFTILEATLKLTPADPHILKEEVADILPQRATYRGLRCPGSFFKNIPIGSVSAETLKQIPEDKINHGKIPAGYLLESAGAKGKKIGDIQVSETHANLIVNLGKGTSKDFYKLVSELAHEVKEKFGITLEPEVQLINLPLLNS